MLVGVLVAVGDGGAGVCVAVVVAVGVLVGVAMIKPISTLAVLFAGMLSLVVVTLAVFLSVFPTVLIPTIVGAVMVTIPPALSVTTVPVNA